MQPAIYPEADHSIDKSLVDRDALSVIHRLRNAGFTAYLVGGSVRDLFLKRKPKDFDISTSAKPEEIKRLFGRQCILIGRRFRLAHLRFGSKILEVSTFRSGESSDGLIVQDNVWGTEQEDVLRRDFTINGLFYDPEAHSVIDYVGGWEDLNTKTLRSIGDPEVRFKQDPVRMLRLLKFQARFGFHIDPETHQALTVCRKEIIKSSPARVLEELFRMLESCAAAPFFHLMLENQLMQLLFPTLANAFQGPRGKEMLLYLQAVDTVNKVSEKYPIERPVLTAALLYPMLEVEIQKQYLSQNKTPHLGEILGTISELMRALILNSFSHFPRRISSIAAFILSTQYRLTPFKAKRQHPVRLFKIREFPLALRLLKIRAQIDPRLQETYISWRENYRQFLRQEETHMHREPRGRDRRPHHAKENQRSSST